MYGRGRARNTAIRLRKWIVDHMIYMSYYISEPDVEIGDEFEPEFGRAGRRRTDGDFWHLSRVVQQFGPQLGRPRVDTLNGSRQREYEGIRFSAA